MKIKYIVTLLIVAIFVSMAGYLCLADEPTVSADTSVEDIAIIEGAVISVEADRLTIRDLSESNVDTIVLISETTVYEGKELLEVGDIVSVQYNGMMTRSIPAQITADVISCHVMTGVVSDMAEGQFLLTLPDECQFAVVYDAEMFIGVQDGMTATVFYNGASTRSLPPQITAEYIRTQGITGVVSNLAENVEFTLTDDNGIDTIVHISPATLPFVELAEGMKVTVTTDGTATLSLPAQVSALEILPAE